MLGPQGHHPRTPNGRAARSGKRGCIAPRARLERFSGETVSCYHCNNPGARSRKCAIHGRPPLAWNWWKSTCASCRRGPPSWSPRSMPARKRCRWASSAASRPEPMPMGRIPSIRMRPVCVRGRSHLWRLPVRVASRVRHPQGKPQPRGRDGSERPGGWASRVASRNGRWHSTPCTCPSRWHFM